MLTKFAINLVDLNRPIVLLCFISIVYLALILKLKKKFAVKNFNESYLDKFLQSNKIEKICTILHSFLIVCHLILLISLLLIKNVNSTNSSNLSGNVSNVLNFYNSNDYQVPIDSKRQTDGLRNFCELKKFNAICNVNDQINQKTSQSLRCLRTYRDLDMKDLKNSLNSCLKFDLKDNDLNGKESNELNEELLNNKNLNDNRSDSQCEKEDFNKIEISDKSDAKTSIQLSLIKIDNSISEKTRAIFRGFAVGLSLAHYFDTLASSILVYKINRNHNVNYQEINYTHIVERVLTPFIVYFDFKFSDLVYLWFTISWSILNIIIRLSYLKKLTIDKQFQHNLVINDLLKAKVFFFSLSLLLTSYLSLNDRRSVELWLVKSFTLLYSLILFLISLSDWEQVLKQKNQTINLDSNNNRIILPKFKILATM